MSFARLWLFALAVTVLTTTHLQAEDKWSFRKLMPSFSMQEPRSKPKEPSALTKLNNNTKALLAKIGYDPSFGARPLKRVIQKEVADELAVLILDGKIEDGDKVQIGVEADSFSFTVA